MPSMAPAPATYVAPGPHTELAPEQATAVRALGLDPRGLCRLAQGLVRDPGDAFGTSLTPEQLADRNTRPVRTLLERLAERDPAPLDQPRLPDHRIVGTCRHVAVLATALLRAASVPARARCGFASYFVPDRWVDHWITELWSPGEARWIRVDAEIMDLGVVHDAFDLPPGAFLTGGEAWQAVRSGAADAMAFGVAGTEHWGPGEIRGNAIRDLAALQKIEVLPWDEWGEMTASYEGATGAAFDEAIDHLATACAIDDRAALAAAYASFAVPPELER